MKKRSVSIAGHRTSISLEQEFWSLLQETADRQKRSVASLIAEIDRDRLTASPAPNLSSAIRIYLLTTLQQQLRPDQTG